jgi:hypothetical protein
LYVVLGVAAAILASVGALSVGSLVFSTFSSVPQQTGATGIPNAPPGVSFPLAEGQVVSGTSTPATGGCAVGNLGTPTSPTLLTNGTSTVLCLNAPVGGFAAADDMFELEIAWSHAAANGTVFKLQISVDVTPSANDIAATSYVNTSVPIVVSEQAFYAVDLTQAGDTSITGFSVLVTEL